MKKRRGLRPLTVAELLYLAMRLGKQPAELVQAYDEAGRQYRGLLRAVLGFHKIIIPASSEMSERDALRILRATAQRAADDELVPASDSVS
jgi:hypothetical protein